MMRAGNMVRFRSCDYVGSLHMYVCRVLLYIHFYRGSGAGACVRVRVCGCVWVRVWVRVWVGMASGLRMLILGYWSMWRSVPSSYLLWVAGGR